MLWWFKTTELDAVKHSRRARCWKWNRFRDLILTPILNARQEDLDLDLILTPIQGAPQCQTWTWFWHQSRSLNARQKDLDSIPTPIREPQCQTERGENARNWNFTKQSGCLEMFREIMAVVSFSANIPKKCQIQQIVTGKQKLKIVLGQFCLMDQNGWRLLISEA